MGKFPVDAPIRRVITALNQLGFELVREGNHIAMLRINSDGTKTPLTIPNHPTIKKVYPARHFDAVRDFQRSLLVSI